MTKPAPASAPRTCALCGKPEGPSRQGAEFKAVSTNGMRLAFWACLDCAVKYGPSQGPITHTDPMDEPG